MPAIRLLLIGYGIAGVCGFAVGMQFGQLAGWLAGWLGGAALSLLIAYAWSRSRVTGTNLSRSAPEMDPIRVTIGSSRRASVVKVWDRDMEEVPAGPQTALVHAWHHERSGSAGPFPARAGQPALMRRIRAGVS